MRGKIKLFLLILILVLFSSFIGDNSNDDLKLYQHYNYLSKFKNIISNVKNFLFKIFIYFRNLFINIRVLLRDFLQNFSHKIDKMINSPHFLSNLKDYYEKKLDEKYFSRKSKLFDKQIFSSNMTVEEKNKKEKVNELKKFCLVYEKNVNDYLLNQYETGLSINDVISIDILYTGSLPDMSKYERYKFRFIKVDDEKYHEIVNSNLIEIEEQKKSQGNIHITQANNNIDKIDKKNIDATNSGTQNKNSKKSNKNDLKVANDNNEKVKLRVVKYKLTLIDKKPVIIAEFAGLKENFYGYLNPGETIIPALPSGYIFCYTDNIPEMSFSIFYYYPLDISNNEVAIGFYEEFDTSKIILYCFIVYIFILIILLLLYILIVSYTFNKIKEKNLCLIKEEKKGNQKYEAGKEGNFKTIIYNARDIGNNEKKEPTRQKNVDTVHRTSQKESYNNVNNNIRNNINYNIEKNEKSSKIDKTDDLKFSSESEQDDFFKDLFKKDENFMEKESLTDNKKTKDSGRDSQVEKVENEATTLEKIGRKIELEEIPHFEDKKD
jgi:hypothetical protein